MLFQSWLLTILVPLALGAPVFRAPGPPTLTILDNIANATSPEKLAESGKKIVLGSKSRLHGSASTDEYPALGNGVGHTGKNILEGQEKGSPWLDAYPTLRNGSSLSGEAGDTSLDPGKMGLNRANKMHTYQKDPVHNGGGNITLSDGETLEESSGGKLGGTSSHGSDSSTASKNKAIGSEGITIDTTTTGIELGSANDTGSGATTTGQQGTTPGTGTTSGSGSTVSGTNIPSPNDRTTSSTSKHK